MSVFNNWYSSYQASNPEKFNNEFIYGRNTNEDLKAILEDVCKSLEIINGITFKGVEIEEDQTKFIQTGYVPLEESRVIQARLNFHIRSHSAINPAEMEEGDVSVPVFFPKLTDNFYYTIGGAKYYAVLQILDRGVYNTNKGISLKTLMMPINLKCSKAAFSDISNGELHGSSINVDLFKKNVNSITYFFAKFGSIEGLKYFGFDPDKLLIDPATIDVKNVPANVRVFDLAAKGKLRYVFNMNEVTEDWQTDFLVTFLDFAKTYKITYDDIYEDSLTKWLKTLGKTFTSTNPHLMEQKGLSILCSLERILDDRTKKNLIHIADHDKADTYSIIRWCFTFYHPLSQEENMDLKNKRLRLSEYLVYPLIRKFSDGAYRAITNSRRANFSSLKSIFTSINPDFCLKKLITSKMLRYSSAVNSFDLFVGLKASQTGPQGLANGVGSELAVKYRGHHESYIGNVGMNACSAGDPGMTMTLTPFVKLDGFFFSTEQQYVTKFKPS